MAKTYCRMVTGMIMLFLLGTCSSFAQTGNDQQENLLSPDSLFRAAKIIIDSSACKVLITVDENGKPFAREMAPFPIEKDWVIWFGTSTISRKVRQIENNPNVVVYYYDSRGQSYVSISGKASLVNDPDLKAKYWFNSWTRYFPDRDKDYILIKVIPESMEIVSYKYNIFWLSNTDPQMFRFD